MSATAKKVVEIALREEGYREKLTPENLDLKTAPNDGPKNYTKYARDLAEAGFFQSSKQGFDWCTTFVCWCVWQATGKDRAATERILCHGGPYAAGVDWAIRYFEDAGRFSETGPQVGDQIFFGKKAHTGLVYAVDSNYVYTIEGNTGSAVKRHRYKLTDPYIYGYGHPLYGAEPEERTERRFWLLRDVPEGYRTETIDRLVRLGILNGKGGTGEETIIDLGEDAIRVLVLNDRAGLYPGRPV